MKIEFDKPYKFEDKEYSEIDLKIEDLTGRDLLGLGRQYAKELGSKVQAVKALDEEYHLIIAEKVSGQPKEFFYNMPAPEFMKVSAQVMGFLMGAA